MRALYAMVLIVMSACAHAPDRVARAREYTVHDVSPDLVRALDAAALEPDAAARVAIVRRTLVDAHPELFTDEILDLPSELPRDPALDARIARMLEAALPRRDEIRAAADAVRNELPLHQARFREAFPDFGYGGSVYFTSSLDGFDGAVRSVDGAPALLFGVDGIVLRHEPGVRIGALFVHELFHLHHIALHPDWETRPPRIVDALWFEGLAVYVARALVPDATLDELVLSEAMVAESDARMPELASELLVHFSSGDEALYADYFLRRGSGRVPRRCAYYVGLRVVELVASSNDLDLAALADLDGTTLDRAIEAALQSLAAT